MRAGGGKNNRLVYAKNGFLVENSCSLGSFSGHCCCLEWIWMFVAQECYLNSSGTRLNMRVRGLRPCKVVSTVGVHNDVWFEGKWHASWLCQIAWLSR